jgi:hypothetical protein
MQNDTMLWSSKEQKESHYKIKAKSMRHPPKSIQKLSEIINIE